MNPEQQSELSSLYESSVHVELMISRFIHKLTRLEEALPDAFASIQKVLTDYSETALRFREAVETLGENCFSLSENRPDSLRESDWTQLRSLNRHMTKIEQFVANEADSLRNNMLLKKNDAQDPMYDFMIEADFRFVLREDDPDFDENDGNFLSSRNEMLSENHEGKDDWRNPFTPEALQREPLCWLLYDLNEHRQGNCMNANVVDS